MAAVGRQRRKDATEPPKMASLPLAFLLLNLTSMANRRRGSRTGGPALLPNWRRQDRSLPGLAAFHDVPSPVAESWFALAVAGVAVIMRYTLRLLTLDQLGRGAALICAM